MMTGGRDVIDHHASALAAMRRLRVEIGALMQARGFDALFYPTLVTTAARITEAETVEIDGDVRPTGPTLLRNTLLAALAGLPSLSLPLGFASDGLPVGGLIEGRPGADAELLQLGLKLAPVLRQQP